MTNPTSTRMILRPIIFATTLLALSACTTAPAGGALAVGQQATITGAVVSADTTPWTYDGNAIVTLSTATGQTVTVQLPARWNLCKASPPSQIQELKPGDRVQAIGTMTAPNELLVCEQPQHTLRKLE